jgi:Protein of unknown function (DUF3892)
VQVPVGTQAGVTVHDRGGYRLSSLDAKVYFFFWGSAWNAKPEPNPSIQDLVNSFAVVLASPYQTAVSQYGGKPLSFGGAYITTGGIDPPGTFHDVDLQTRAMEIVDFNYSIPAYEGDLYVLVAGPGARYANAAVTAAHSDFWDIRALSYIHYAWLQFDTLDNMTLAFSHELVEAITDPRGDAVQIDPINDSSWNEIGDVCEGFGARINGVQVQAYWSANKSACVVPQDVPVRNRQITCISKSPVNSPRERIKAVGGISVESGEQFFVTQEHCIADIDKGMRYFVVGTDGTQADVHTGVHFSEWEPTGHRFIATAADASEADNLLSLPQCPFAVRVAEP